MFFFVKQKTAYELRISDWSSDVGSSDLDSWYTYDPAGRMTSSNGAMSAGEIRPKPRTAGSVRIRYDKVGRRDRTTEFQGPYSAGPLSTHRTWDTMRDELYDYDDMGHLRRIDQNGRAKV